MTEIRQVLNRLLIVTVKLNRMGNNKKMLQVEEAINEEIEKINIQYKINEYCILESEKDAGCFNIYDSTETRVHWTDNLEEAKKWVKEQINKT
jgi:hypothetical protein